MQVIPGDFADPQVVALLREHLVEMYANSPPGSVYALDLSALQASGITFVTAWNEAGLLLGCGALKHLDASSVEIKSMRTAKAHLRQGAAACILEHLLVIARSRGYSRVSLETGSGAAFAPALALYRKFGFVHGDAFGDYVATEFNQFLHLEIAPT